MFLFHLIFSMMETDGADGADDGGNVSSGVKRRSTGYNIYIFMSYGQALSLNHL